MLNLAAVMTVMFKAILVAILFLNCLDDADSCGGGRRSRRCVPRHGGWGSWRPVVSNCNSGLRRWYRHCDNPSPNSCGKGCTGSREKWEDCNECSSGYHSCDHVCHNTYGSYYCSCNYGYRLEGRHQCKRMTCSTSNWKAPSNGQMTSYVCNNGNVVNYGQVCAVRCNYGYELDPSLPSRSTCGSHGNWYPSSRARCKAKTCRQIYLPSKMTVSPIQCLRSPVHGQVCHLKCLEDFTLEGSATSTCEDGSWTKNNFRCKDKEPPTFNRGCPDNINTKADEGKTTATITWEQPLVSDNDGQRPYLVFSPAVNLPYPYQEGRHFITYIARDRAWNSRSCSFHINVTVLRCQQFTVPENGRLVGSSCNNIYGSVCTVDCNHGYKLVGSGSRKCVKTNNTVGWNGQSAYCESIKCLVSATPPDAIKSGCAGEYVDYGTTCQFRCRLGYKAVNGTQHRTCRADKTWSGAPIVCKEITCPPLPNITSESLIVDPPTCLSNRSPYDTECHFRCKQGYKFIGVAKTTCTISEIWSNQANPFCIDETPPSFGASCPADIVTYANKGTTLALVSWTVPTATDTTGVSPNVTLSKWSRQPGSLFPAGEHIIMYVASDQAGNTAECSFKVTVKVIYCLPKLLAPTSGSIDCNFENKFGSQCNFACRDGHTMQGSQQRHCVSFGQPPGIWTGNLTTCEVVKCPVLPTPAFGIKSGCVRRGGTNIYGDSCRFYCQRGYRVVSGSPKRSCLANGTWTGKPLHCAVVKCAALTLPKDGDVAPSVCQSAPKYGITCQYICGRGYRINGPQIRSCLASGQWSHNESVSCSDVEQPSFGNTCPSDIRRYAERGVNHTTITWPPVVATDNSGQLPVVVSQGVQPIYEKGVHFVTYTATDTSGNKAMCSFKIIVEVLRCPILLSPINGFFRGECDSTFGSTCHAECKVGYNLLGSANRTCEVYPGHLIGHWTGSSTVCKVRSCSSLQTPSNGYLYPPMCAFYPYSGTNCSFGCYPGFVKNGKVDYLHCSVDGKWNKNLKDIIACIDNTPPSFGGSCPSDIIGSLGQNGFASVNWTVPTAFDNSGDTPTLKVQPAGVQPPYSFNETTMITYTAIDSAGNEDTCSFKISVEDNLGPVTVYCPTDQNITATSTTTRVYWRTPEFKDNSNSPLTIYCNRQSGDNFYWGEWNVNCRAHDNNPRNAPAVCTFVVRARPKKCPVLTPPKNGATACDDWMFGQFCSPFCNNRWDFSQPLIQSVWACGASGRWMPSYKWPDCSETFNPDNARQAISLHYFSGDCNSPSAQQQIRSQFIQILNQSVFQEVCQDKQFQDRCIADNVKVTCAVVDMDSSRRRRSLLTQRYIATIEADILVNLEDSRNSTANLTSEEMRGHSAEALTLTKKLSSEIKQSFENGSLKIAVNGEDLVPDNGSFTMSSPKLTCSKGQIVKSGRCVNCAVGTYLNTSMAECLDCLKGWYQDEEAQLQCHRCPSGMSTVGVRASNASECKALCEKGFYSPDGLAPCYPCDKGFYQEKKGSTNCKLCPRNTTTNSTGSVSSGRCRVPCAPGTFSLTGLEPCSACERRSYQPLSESKACEVCPGTTIALSTGASSVAECIEINECDSNPCHNSGTCVDLVGDYLCKCPTGYTGKNCETDIDYCNSNPCLNNATCFDHVVNFTCNCAPGFEGITCFTNIDECKSSPCHNNGSCEDLVNGFKCLCQSGYKGNRCQQEINECDAQPCVNNGSCIDLLDDFLCNCRKGFEGKRCEIDIDNCTSSPCMNNAICVDKINDYECKCQQGFIGKNCETNVDECASTPCKNNATCYDRVNGYDCACARGYNGTKCDYEVNECLSNPCRLGASCVDLVGAFKCECPQGFDGMLCENDVDDCASDPCTGNSTCLDKVDDFKCVCQPGFTGKLCNTDIDECISNPCHNNASCSDGINHYMCQCLDGFTGSRCEIDIDDCRGNPCNNGSCVDGINKYRCSCLPGFTGRNCETDINECASNPCENEGQCRDLVNDFVCSCRPGFTGKSCKINIDECVLSPCKNNGTCVDGINLFSCECGAGFTGKTCDVNIDDCPTSNCTNGGTCLDGIMTYDCACSPGYAGTYCEMEIDECQSYPCANGATCVDKINGYTCRCPSGFNGSKCDSNINDCSNNTCLNGATCIDLVNNHTCTCRQGFEGKNCESRKNYCLHSNCSSHSVCTNTLEGFMCNCSSGYYGKYCDLEVNECESSPCMEDATCTDKVNGFDCHCPQGFTGRLCEVDIDDCVNNSCKNNATCVDKVVNYQCICRDGYNGVFCENEIDECQPNPCLNNGTCQDIIGGYICHCNDDFTGVNCENVSEPCNSGPCLNNGQCNSTDNFTYTCACKPGYTGINCENEIDECASSPCSVNQYCKDMVNGYTCKCLPSFTGEKCEIPFGSNFDLEFTRKSTTDTALIVDREIPNLGSFTVAFWIKTRSQSRADTIMHYQRLDDENERLEIILRSKEVNVLFKNQTLRVQNINVRDGKWHCIGLVRDREDGTILLYLNGKEVHKTVNILRKEWLLGGGSMVLGQRYSPNLKSFLTSDSYVGSIHQLHVWNLPLTASNMWTAAHSCGWPIGGDVLAWVQFLSGIRGEVLKQFPSRCKAQESCSGNCSHVDYCDTINDDYHCNCQPGYTGMYCDVDINECLSKPCVHGQCQDAVNSYRCLCDKGYYGAQCEKKIKEQKVCSPLAKPKDGKISCQTYEGKEMCHLICDKGYSLKKSAVTSYGCGPETDFKWNKQDEVQLPNCLKTSNPVEMKQEFSVAFPMPKCQTEQQFQTVKESLNAAFVNSIRSMESVHSCFQSKHCELNNIRVEGCEQFSNRGKRSSNSDVNVLFMVILRDTNNPTDVTSVTEKSEALLFNMKYSTAIGDFKISIKGQNITAKRDSFQHLFSSFSCKDGYIPGNDNTSCVACPLGTYHKTSTHECVRCSLGTFQDREAQTSCKICPKSQKTKIEGASVSSDCGPGLGKQQDNEESTTLWPIVGGVLAFVFVVAVTIAVFCCYRCRKAGGRPCRTETSIKMYASARKDSQGIRPDAETYGKGHLDESRYETLFKSDYVNHAENPKQRPKTEAKEDDHLYAEIEEVLDGMIQKKAETLC